MKRAFDLQSNQPLFGQMMALEKAASSSGLDRTLIELVKTRVSQINGCAFCLEMHTREAIGAGEKAERLFLLSAWRESALYSSRERAALAWAEALTELPGNHHHDPAAFEGLRGEFDEDEIVKLTYVVSTINAWNRLAIASLWPQAGKAEAVAA